MTANLYFNAGTFGPIPTCFVKAAQERLQAEYLYGRLGESAWAILMTTIYERRTHKCCTALERQNEGEIALTDNTGEGMNIISFGFDWREGDEVITTNHEHISALAPLYQLRDRYGIVIGIAISPRGEQPALKAIADLVTPRTRLIVLSHVDWITGALLNISRSRNGTQTRYPGIGDGAQSAGDTHRCEGPRYRFLCHPHAKVALRPRWHGRTL